LVRALKRIIICAVCVAAAGYCIKLAADFVLPLKHYELIKEYSERHGLDPALVFGLVNAESRFRERAVSSAGAEGLMQMTPPTAVWAADLAGLSAEYEKKGLTDPETSVALGCWYLARLLRQFGNERTALAAYNAGEGRVRFWLSDAEFSSDGVTLRAIPYRETRDYVRRVDLYKRGYAVRFWLRDFKRPSAP
jgi:soluble lytic murein transglycosylase